MGSLQWYVVGALQTATDAGDLPFSTTTIGLLGGSAILLLLVLSAFFSSSEIAMFSLPPHRVDALVSENVPSAETLKHLKDDPHRLLVTILVGNNIVNIAMSSIATGLLAIYFSQSMAVFLATFGITALVLLFGESAPKSYAVENTESWALRIARPLRFAEYLLLPLIVTFDYLTRQVNRLTGGQSSIESTYVTREEIRDIIETGERAGVLEEDEREMLQRIFRFTNTIAKEIMTPRLDMEAVSKDATVDEAIQACVRSGHTRVPVYDGSLDNVMGIVHVSDLIRDNAYGEREDLDLEDLIEETLHVPESKNVDELLAEMRETRMHMVIVIDEFGTTEGLVTMEDITEEIVGEILQAGEEEPIEFLDDRTAIVKGELNIDEINEELDIDIPEGEEFETIAGFIFNRAGRLVEEGEVIEYDGIEIHVERVENTRIMKARLVRTEDYDEKREEEPPEEES
ncbi:HlyC/CorC family transporter [Natronomonas salina]|uniref:hemolysin family protein n=1 Tax=Natronomonas salina TaxID=1710540 RepID=UPI0015B397FB|nr:hemolysin family protein [Natronomonas salina]QLD88978.1 HlyC/CorC family transporter [Natronomonas salina]